MGGMGFISANHATILRNNQDAYGWETLSAERLCLYYSGEFGLDTRIVRFHSRTWRPGWRRHAAPGPGYGLGDMDDALGPTPRRRPGG